MRGKKAKMLRKMAEAGANPKYTERMYTVKKYEYKKLIDGKAVSVIRSTFANAADSARGIYQRLKRGG